MISLFSTRRTARLSSWFTPLSCVVLLTGLALSAAPARAADVTELELDGTAVNNTLPTSQVIVSSAFTPNVNPNVFGNLPTATILGRGSINTSGEGEPNGTGLDVDFYQFTTGVGTGYFDIDIDPNDPNPNRFDTFLALFDGSGTFIGYADDHFPADPGSVSNLDSFLGTFTFTQAGTYYIAVSTFGNLPTQFSNATIVYSSLTAPDDQDGGFTASGAVVGESTYDFNGLQTGNPYTLNISLSNPGGLAVGPEPGSFALVGVVLPLAGWLRRRARR